MTHDICIIDAVRTPRGIGKPGKGALAGLHPQHLLAGVLSELVTRTGISDQDIDDVIIGCNTQAGKQGLDIARMAALDAGYDVRVPGVTLDRFCASGLSAIQFAALGVLSGTQHLVVAGGVESMSHNAALQREATIDSGNLRLRRRYPQPHQGVCADLIATIEGIDRPALDAAALQSQQRADTAIRERRFASSLVPVRDSDGNVVLDHEEYPRPQTTLAGLEQLKPAFSDIAKRVIDEQGSTFLDLARQVHPDVKIVHAHTAATSSGVVDAAAALILASSEYALAHGLKPRARIRAMATVGDDPTLMLNGPKPATQQVLTRAGMAVSDIDLFEINEAFAVVPLKYQRDFDLDPDRVNVNGGAMALGHPIGATGAILIGTLLDELERRDLQRGLVTMCAAGGMAPAVIIERM